MTDLPNTVLEAPAKVHMGATIPTQQYGNITLNVTLNGADEKELIARAQAAIGGHVAALVTERLEFRRQANPDSDLTAYLKTDQLFVWLAAFDPAAAAAVWKQAEQPQTVIAATDPDGLGFNN